MAETATVEPEAQTGAERALAPQPAQATAPEPGSPAWLSNEITGTFTKAQQARDREVQGLRESAAAQEPAIQRAEASVRSFAEMQPAQQALVDQARTQWKAVQAQQPSRQPSAFFQAREGESAEASIQKLLGALNLFAGAIGGLAGGNARGALAAFTGAMRGWQEGDKARGDAAFADWKAKSQAALDNWEMERATYDSWVKDTRLSMDNALAGLKLAGYRANNKQMILAAESGNLTQALGELQTMQKHADEFANQRLRIIEMARVHDENERHNRRMEEMKREELTLKQREVGESMYNPAVVDDLAQRYNRGEPLAQLVRGFGKSAAKNAAEIQARALERRTQGIDASDPTTERNRLAANSAALKKITAAEAEFRSFLTTFERTVENARRLSKEYERSGVPLWNAVRLKAQVQTGSVAAKNWDVQMDILAQELARVTTRQRNTTVEARMHAREQLNAAQTQEQFEGLIQDVLKKDAAFALEGFAREKAVLQQDIRGPQQPPGGGEVITIVRDKDGKLVRQ